MTNSPSTKKSLPTQQLLTTFVDNKNKTTFLSENNNGLLDTEKAAQFLDVSPKTLEAWRLRGGDLKFVRLSRKAVKYRLSDLYAFIEKRLKSSTSEL